MPVDVPCANHLEDVSNIDVLAKNKWKWDWVSNTPLEGVIKKALIDGTAYCKVCMKTVKYGTSGQLTNI